MDTNSHEWDVLTKEGLDCVDCCLPRWFEGKEEVRLNPPLNITFISGWISDKADHPVSFPDTSKLGRPSSEAVVFLRPEIINGLLSTGRMMNPNLAFAGYVANTDRIIVAADGSVFKCYEDDTFWYWAPDFNEFLNLNLMGEKRAAYPPEYAPGNWKWIE